MVEVEGIAPSSKRPDLRGAPCSVRNLILSERLPRTGFLQTVRLNLSFLTDGCQERQPAKWRYSSLAGICCVTSPSIKRREERKEQVPKTVRQPRSFRSSWVYQHLCFARFLKRPPDNLCMLPLRSIPLSKLVTPKRNEPKNGDSIALSSFLRIRFFRVGRVS